MEKNIDVTVMLDGNEITLEFYEPESGDFRKMNFDFGSCKQSEFNEAAGNELYSWVSLMAEEFEED